MVVHSRLFIASSHNVTTQALLSSKLNLTPRSPLADEHFPGPVCHNNPLVLSAWTVPSMLGLSIETTLPAIFYRAAFPVEH